MRSRGAAASRFFSRGVVNGAHDGKPAEIIILVQESDAELGESPKLRGDVARVSVRLVMVLGDDLVIRQIGELVTDRRAATGDVVRELGSGNKV